MMTRAILHANKENYFRDHYSSRGLAKNVKKTPPPTELQISNLPP